MKTQEKTARSARVPEAAAPGLRVISASPQQRRKTRQCTAKKLNGKRCSCWAVGGSNRCAFHTPEIAGPARSRGGRAGANYIGEPTQAPATPGEVQSLLSETLVGVSEGRVPPPVGSAVSALCNNLLKAMEINDVCQRMEALKKEMQLAGVQL